MKTILYTAILLLFTATALQAQDLTPFKDANGKYGYKDKSGKIIVKPKYDVAEDYGQDGLAVVNIGGFHNVSTNDIQGGKSGLIDKTGKEVVPLKYDYVYPNFIDGYTTVKLNEKWGIIDKTGKETVPLKYYKIPTLDAYPLVEVSIYGKKGFVDKKTGKEIVPPKYDDVVFYSEDMAAVKMGGKWGFVDNTGKEVIPVQYEIPSYLEEYLFFQNGKVQVRKNGRSFPIDKTGKEISDIITLSPDFYNQFKVLLRANWEDAVKEGGNSHSSPNVIVYESNKLLDGFEVTANKGKTGPYKTIEASGKVYGDANVKLYEQIIAEVKKLKNEGYHVANGAPVEDELKTLWVYKEITTPLAVVSLYRDNSIQISFDKKQSTATSTNNNTTTSTTNTLSPNFYSQFKTFLTTKWEDVKGVPIDKEVFDDGVTVTYYESKKPLEGFVVKSAAEGQFKYVWIYRNSHPTNVQLYTQINTELKKLKNEGYEIKETNTSNGFLGYENVVKLTQVVKNNYTWADVLLYKDNYLEIIIRPATTIKSTTTNSNTKPTTNTTTTNSKTTTTSGIAIPANSSAAVPEPMESKFRTAFNAATNSKERGKALGDLFGDVYKNSSLTEDKKKILMSWRISEVYALDKEAAFEGVMKAACPTSKLKEILKLLPADQQAFIKKGRKSFQEVLNRYPKRKTGS